MIKVIKPSRLLKVFSVLLFIQIAAYPFSLFSETLLYWKPDPRLNYIAQENFKFYEVALYIMGYFDEETPEHITNNSKEHKTQTPQTTVFVWDCRKKVNSMYSLYGDLFRQGEQERMIRACRNYNRAVKAQLDNLRKASNSHKMIKNKIQDLFNTLDRLSKDLFEYSQSIVEKKLLLIDIERNLAPLLEKVNEKNLNLQELFKKFADYIIKNSDQHKKLSELIDLFIADLSEKKNYNEEVHGFFINILKGIQQIIEGSDEKEVSIIKAVQDELKAQSDSPVSWLFKWKRIFKDQIQQEIDDLEKKETDAKEDIANINQEIDLLEAELITVWDAMLNKINYHYYMDVAKGEFSKTRTDYTNLRNLFIILPSFYFDFQMYYASATVGVEINAKKRAEDFFDQMKKWLGFTIEKNENQNPNLQSIGGGSSGRLVP